MKKISNLFLFGTLLFAFACSEDVPSPALPDLSKFPEDPIKSFSIIDPVSDLSLNIKKGATELKIKWYAAEDADTYEWIADEADGDFSTPLLTIPSNSEGVDTVLTLNYTQIYDALGEAGVAEGQKIKLKWTVKAKSGSIVRLATSPRVITFQRGGVRFTVYVPDNTPAGYDVYMAGSFGFLPSSWDQPGTNPSLKMSKNSDGTYSIILGIPVDESVEYKYFIAPTGGSSWGNGEQKPKLDGSGDIEGAPNRTFTYNGTNDEVYQNVSFWEGFNNYPYILFNLTAPANTPVDRDVYVTGSLGFVNVGWAEPGSVKRLKMTRVSNTSFYIVLPKGNNGDSFQYKYFVGPGWSNGENGGNRDYTFAGSNNLISSTVTAWDGI